MIEISIQNAVRYGHIENVKKGLSKVTDQAVLDKFLSNASYSEYAGVDILEVLLNAGANPNSYETQVIGDKTYYGGTPLGLATARGDLKKVKLLLKRGADISFSTPNGGCIMNAAVCAPDEFSEEIVKYFITLNADLDREGKCGGGTAISVASRLGKFNIVNLLLKAGANSAVLEWDELKHKIAYGSIEECKKAIQSGCSLQSVDGWDRTAFLLSVLSGDISKTQLLLENGASLNERGRCEMTCLMYAVHKNDVEMCKWLISKGANVNEVTDFGTTALIEAAQYGASDCVKVLLEAGANLHAETVTQGCAIENAINIETVRVLVDAGADINRIGGDGYNLLMHAVERRNYKFLKELLEIDADPNAANLGRIPLHKASWWGEEEMVKLLLEYGSDPNAKDGDDETPLHWVKSVEIARMLMEAGAKYDIMNIVGQTALDYAEDEAIRKIMLSKTKNDH